MLIAIQAVKEELPLTELLIAFDRTHEEIALLEILCGIPKPVFTDSHQAFANLRPLLQLNKDLSGLGVAARCIVT